MNILKKIFAYFWVVGLLTATITALVLGGWKVVGIFAGILTMASLIYFVHEVA